MITRRTHFAVLLGLGLTLVSGCGKKGPPEAYVTGKVTIGGQPPSSPVLVNYSDSMNGQFGMSPTKPDGSYDLIMPLKPGNYVVSFDKPSEGDGPIGTSAKGLTLVPPEYRTEEKSPLKQEVKEGKNVINLEVPGPKS
ncbi:MAG TPA: hypothetical protein VM510_16520 [Caulifigura sp.]|jgi:hypothetical protein|nr:hypothetical protein [Caulifigura sp.]